MYMRGVAVIVTVFDADLDYVYGAGRMSRKCKNFTLRCTSDMPELTVTKGTFTLVQINVYSILLHLLQIQ